MPHFHMTRLDESLAASLLLMLKIEAVKNILKESQSLLHFCILAGNLISTLLIKNCIISVSCVMFEVVSGDGTDLNQLNEKTYCYCSFRNIVQ